MINNNGNPTDFQQVPESPVSSQLPPNPPNLGTNPNELNVISQETSESPSRKKIDILLWLGVVLVIISLVIATYKFIGK